ncbi:TonB-dependent receptor [Thermomonas paludicola]|uniref:TonB-dependent receptor n=1 Tax=Thermomonas paludicola TaxID=2884874 RepID=UPI002113C548|nr:TonB-dependent receptor [Thermomonas paludicola]
MKHHILTDGVRKALLASLLASAAFSAQAQETPQAQPAAKPDAVQLDKIVVTAQSREQELQDVPIALQVVDADVIDTTAARTIADLDSFIPGLDVNDVQATQVKFKLRGLSTEDIGIGTDPTVGVYVDGVYAGRGGGTVLPFLDVERIEVLKGPQGTLFGRNTAAGAISIITKQPSATLEARARLRAGDHGQRQFDGMFNMPLGDHLALRINALHGQTDGWLRDAATGRPLNDGKNDALRMALGWDASDRTRVQLTWDRERLNQRSRPTIGIVDLDPVTGLPAFPADPLHYRNPFDMPATTDVAGNDETRDFDGLTLRVEHDFRWGALAATTAWRHYDTFNRTEEDGTNRAYLYMDSINSERNTTWYQEFKFSGGNERIDWVAGASWFKERARQSSVVDLDSSSVDTATLYALGIPLFSMLQAAADQYAVPVQLLGQPWTESYDNTLASTAYAAFGDVIWHATDKLNLTVGLRYTRDEKQFSWFNDYHRADALNQALQILDSAGILAGAGLDAATLAGMDLAFSDPVSMANKGVLNRASHAWSDVSPRLVIDYHLANGSMVFASLAKGYKAGGYNAFSPGASFKNEEVWNLEAGIKQSLQDGRLQFEASAYRYQYNNRQAIWLDTSTQVPRYVTNVSDLTATGAEFSARWFPSRALQFDFNLGWIDSTYDHYVTPQGLNLSGKPTGEPRISYALGGRYRVELGEAGSLLLSARHGARGAMRCNAASIGQGNCGSYPAFRIGAASNRTDLFVQWRSPKDAWSVAAYANNVFNQRHVTDLWQYGTSVFGTVGASISAPRQLGLEMQFRY